MEHVELEQAHIDISNHKETEVYLANFSNGRLNSDQDQNTNLACFQSDEKHRSHERRLVCETEEAEYSGSNIVSKAMPTGCKYMLAAYNKRTGKVHLYDTEMYNMKPVFPDEEDKVDGSESEEELTYREKLDKLTSAFGGKKRKRAMESRLRNKIDDASLDTALTTALTTVMSQPGAHKRTAKRPVDDIMPSGIPPHNKDATTPAEAYVIPDIISEECMSAMTGPAEEFITCDLSKLSTWVKEKKFPEFVLNQLAILPQETDARTEKAKCLKYLHFMILMYKLTSVNLRQKEPLPQDVPKIVQKSLFKMFTVEVHVPSKRHSIHGMPARLKDKLLFYILTLCLIIENFKLEITSLMGDLKLSQYKITTTLKSLGCSIHLRKISTADGSTIPMTTASLPIPLKFPVKSEKSRKSRK